jgi:hypothetical protein
MRGYDTLFAHPVNDNYIIKIMRLDSGPRPELTSSPITAPRVALSFRFWSSRAARS